MKIKALNWPNDSTYEYFINMSDCGSRAVIYSVTGGHLNKEITSAAAGIVGDFLANGNLDSQMVLESLRDLLKQKGGDYIYTHWVELRRVGSSLTFVFFGDGLIAECGCSAGLKRVNSAAEFGQYVSEGYVSVDEMQAVPLLIEEVASCKTCYVFGRGFSDGAQISDALRFGKLELAIDFCGRLRTPLFEVQLDRTEIDRP